jgi:hypothetical protein
MPPVLPGAKAQRFSNCRAAKTRLKKLVFQNLLDTTIRHKPHDRDQHVKGN